MANPQIQVEIGAVIDGLRKGFGESVSIIKTLKDEAERLEKALDNATDIETIQSLNVDLAKTRNALAQLRTAGVEPLTRATDKLNDETARYNSVGTDFARIIQDAPFGIIGVGNNITQLAGSFQQLKGQTGSTSAALKTAFASIFSSGNALILGISALTTVFTVLQMKGFFKTEEAAKSLKDRLDEYKDTLDDLSRANLEGAGNAQKEIQNLQLLRKQAENTAVSQEKRLEAVNALQKQYPSYLGNIGQEEILNGRADVAYKNITQSILAKAKAQASANQIAQNAIQILTLETKLEEQRTKRLIETSSAQAQIDALIQKRQSAGFLTQGEIQLYDQLISRINKANETLSEDEELLKEKLRLLEQNVKLEGNVTALIEQGATFTNETNTAKKESIKLEDELIARIEASNKLRDEAAKKLVELGSKLKVGSPDFKEVNVDTSGFTPTDIVPDIDDSAISDFLAKLKFVEDEFKAYGGRLNEAAINFTLDLKNTLQQNLFEAFVGVGDAIGSALATGENVLSAIGKSLLGSLANFLGDFGQQLIAFGVAGIAFGSLMETIKKGGPLSIPAGIGAIAAGTALIAISSAIKSRASQGLDGGGSSIGTSGVGGGGGSSFIGGGIGGFLNLDREIQLVSVVRGNDIVLVSERAMDRVNKG